MTPENKKEIIAALLHADRPDLANAIAQVPDWIQQQACGNCFEWALDYMVDKRFRGGSTDGIKLVQGACLSPMGFYFAHGWIEAGGKAMYREVQRGGDS